MYLVIRSIIFQPILFYLYFSFLVFETVKSPSIYILLKYLYFGYSFFVNILKKDLSTKNLFAEKKVNSFKDFGMQIEYFIVIKTCS